MVVILVFLFGLYRVSIGVCVRLDLICLNVFCCFFFYVYWFFFWRRFLMVFVLLVRCLENLFSWFIMLRNVFIFCMFWGGGRFVIVCSFLGFVLILLKFIMCFRNLILFVLKWYLFKLSVMLVLIRCLSIVFNFWLCLVWFLLWIKMLFMMYFMLFNFWRIRFIFFWNFLELELILKGNILK